MQDDGAIDNCSVRNVKQWLDTFSS